MYEPAELTVNRGDKVIWTNSGMYPRSATCSGLFDTGMIGPGDNAAVVMQKAGECDYISMNLPTMKAHIKINEVD
jgi:plastocyanin